MVGEIGFAWALHRLQHCLAYVVDVDLSALRARSCNVCLAHSCVALTSTEVEELNASLDAFMFVLGKKGLPSI